MIAKNQKLTLRFKNTLAILAMLGLILGFFPSRAAADNVWNGTSGCWTTPGDWSLDRVPIITDTASIPAGVATLGGMVCVPTIANTGTVVVGGGSVVINGSNELNAYVGGVMVNNDGELGVVGGSLTIYTGVLSITNAGIVEIESGGNITAYNGVTISGSSPTALDVDANGGATPTLAVPSLTGGAGGETVSFDNAILSVLSNSSSPSTPLISNFGSTNLGITSRGLTINANGLNGTNGEIDSIISDAGGGGGTLTIMDSSGTGNGMITLAAANTYSGSTTINSGMLRLGNGTTAGSIANSSNIAISSGGTLAFNEPSNTSPTMVSNSITGLGALTQMGPSTVILTNSGNTYTGTTTINPGATLELEDGTAAANKTGDIVDNGTLTFNEPGSASTTVPSLISGTGGLMQIGTNTVILTNSGNTYTGTTTINPGATLELEDGTAAANKTGDIVDNGTLTFNEPGSASTTVPSLISGTGGLMQIGTNTVILTNQNSSYTGTVTISAGTLQLGDGNTSRGSIANSSNIAISSGGTLIFNEPVSYSPTFSNVISGTGGVEQVNNNTITLNGASYNGPTTVSAGTLIFSLNESTSVGSSTSPVSVTNNATLQLNSGNLTASTITLSNTGGRLLAFGGVISTNEVSGGGTSLLGFEGGTLTALRDSNPFVSGPVEVSSGGLFGMTLNTSGYTVDISGSINGSGDLIVDGSGTLILNNPNNTYIGDTQLNSFTTLQLGDGTNTGTAGTGNIAMNNGVLVFNEPSSVNGITIANTITGNGTVLQMANTVILTNPGGLSSYEGSTNIDPGTTLQLGNGSTSGTVGSSDIFDDGTLTFDEPVNMTVANFITGNGSVTQKGANSTITLTTVDNVNNYMGGTTITAGTLQLGNGTYAGLVGTGPIMNSGSLVFDEPNNATVTVPGAISGSGSLTQMGSGSTVILTSTNPNYSGTTTITAGTLQLGDGSSTGLVGNNTNTITNNGTLAFNEPSGDTPIPNEITGTGTLEQLGPGTVILNGMSNSAGSSINVGTNVNGGSLLIGMGATLTSNVAVNSGGELQGYGTIVGTVTNNGGIVSPADAIGTLTINGNYVQETGTYMVQVDNQGDSDLLVVEPEVGVPNTGNASLAGMIQVNATVNGFRDNYLYTVLTATGGVTGQFSNTDVNGAFNQAFLQAQVFYNPHSVQFEIGYNAAAFMQAAQTPNQQSVANYILTNGSTTAIQSLIASITTDAQFQAAMDQISGATYANQSLMLARTGNGFSSELSDRLSAFPSCDDAETSELPGEEGVESCEEQNQWWFAVHGAQERINAGQASGLNADSGDAALGYEWSLDPETKVGVGGAYNHLSSHATANEMGHTSGDLYQVGLYGRYRMGDWLFGAALDAGTTNEMNAQRQIQGANGIVSTGGNYRACLFSQQARASYDLLVEDVVAVSPFIGVINQQLSHSSFSENGTTGFELNIEGSTYHSTRSQLGALIQVPMEDSEIKPFASVDWEYEFGNQNAVFNANVVGVGGQFRVEGQPIGRNMALVKAGAVLLRGENWNVAASYEGSFGNAWQQNGATLQASMMFG